MSSGSALVAAAGVSRSRVFFRDLLPRLLVSCAEREKAARGTEEWAEEAGWRPRRLRRSRASGSSAGTPAPGKSPRAPRMPHRLRRLDDLPALRHRDLKGSGDVLDPDEKRDQGRAALQWADATGYRALDTGIYIAVTGNPPPGNVQPNSFPKNDRVASGSGDLISK